MAVVVGLKAVPLRLLRLLHLLLHNSSLSFSNPFDHCFPFHLTGESLNVVIGLPLKQHLEINEIESRDDVVAKIIAFWSASKMDGCSAMASLVGCIYITKGLNKRTTSEKLREAFLQFGNVVHARVVTDRVSGYSKGFGFVQYATVEEAAKGIEGMDGKLIMLLFPLFLRYDFFHGLETYSWKDGLYLQSMQGPEHHIRHLGTMDLDIPIIVNDHNIKEISIPTITRYDQRFRRALGCNVLLNSRFEPETAHREKGKKNRAFEKQGMREECDFDWE
ncbi:RNA recognition motif domain [Dillenia turbinata]|uniref:RNA recognition motif domain n=1 Tax=Dillenia turbinata TaxID=194707 RepID=A0AAN8W621_9MAGN